MKWEPECPDTPLLFQIMVHSVWWAETLFHGRKDQSASAGISLTIHFLLGQHHKSKHNFLNQLYEWQLTDKKFENTPHSLSRWWILHTHTHAHKQEATCPHNICIVQHGQSTHQIKSLIKNGRRKLNSQGGNSWTILTGQKTIFAVSLCPLLLQVFFGKSNQRQIQWLFLVWFETFLVFWKLWCETMYHLQLLSSTSSGCCCEPIPCPRALTGHSSLHLAAVHAAVSREETHNTHSHSHKATANPALVYRAGCKCFFWNETCKFRGEADTTPLGHFAIPSLDERRRVGHRARNSTPHNSFFNYLIHLLT